MASELPSQQHLVEAEKRLGWAENLEEEGDYETALYECEFATDLAGQVVEDGEAPPGEALTLLADAHNLRGIILEALERKEEAADAYRAALGVDPTFRQASDNLRELEEELAREDEVQMVTIATFSDPMEAHIYRGRLEVEGIQSLLANESMVAANWLFSNFVGGVQLQVWEEDVETAREILDMDAGAAVIEDADTELQGDEYLCPDCGSHHVHYQRYQIGGVFLTQLLLGFPLPLFKRTWECEACGHEWKQE